jgi:hypothetical protein
MAERDARFSSDPTFPFAKGHLSTLLEDDEIGGWASEAAVRYRVSALDVLGALVQRSPLTSIVDPRIRGRNRSDP